MTEFEDFLTYGPYSKNQKEKACLLADRLGGLCRLHYENCEEYRKLLNAFLMAPQSGQSVLLEKIPFLPVRIFRDMDLLSVPADRIFKTMTSSGTTGQKVSKIYLDRKTAASQQKALVKIVSDFTGKSRMPVLMIDSPSVLKDRRQFSARGAGILGFSIFASDRQYALTDHMEPDFAGMEAFLDRHKGETILLFGFTFMIWRYFYKALAKAGRFWDLSQAVLIHGGGWKKLESESVSPQVFREKLYEVCGIRSVHDYYGMVEQTGCIYMECEYGHLHASIFSDVIVRRARDFSVCDFQEKGMIQVLSAIPESYPGHSILTEDEGMILGEDDCPCGRKGKYFKITGRIRNAEVRGCSDTYEEH